MQALMVINDLVVLLRAAKILQPRKDITIVFSDGKMTLHYKHANQENLDNTLFLPPIPRLLYWCLAAAFACDSQGDIQNPWPPSQVFDYMAAGKQLYWYRWGHP
jgi:hypothetical protein